ncbi:MAG: hypothetical protein HDS95_02295 [Bacteroidales bacterium]|nr:hypothetical protein [Bacteroidales bacterium]
MFQYLEGESDCHCLNGVTVSEEPFIHRAFLYPVRDRVCERALKVCFGNHKGTE